MRRICIPEELAPLYLTEVEEIGPPLQEMLQTWGAYLPHREALKEALDKTEHVFAAAWNKRDRYAAAIARLHQADLLYRQERLEEALLAAKEAIGWLKMQTSQTARYNEAIAAYFEGIIHYLLYADTQATQAFIHAQSLLQESERYWGMQGNTDHLEDCRNLLRWITQLITLRAQAPSGEDVLIVPVYEYGDQGLRIRLSAMVIPSILVHLPATTLQNQALMSDTRVIPLDIDTVQVLPPPPNTHYLAIKIKTDGQFIPESKAGEYLLVEMLGSARPSAKALLTAHTFERRANGRIIFRPEAKNKPEFTGIPRALIKKREEMGG